jgi:Ni,Fe-hydrogenase I large subunit
MIQCVVDRMCRAPRFRGWKIAIRNRDPRDRDVSVLFVQRLIEDT